MGSNALRYCPKCDTETYRDAVGNCGPCAKARARRYYLANHQTCTEKMRVRYREKRTEILSKNRAIHQDDPRKQMLRASRGRAKQAGLPHTISREDIVIPTHCPVLGIKLSVGGDRNSSPSLDRLVGDLGYVPMNVVVISYRANRMKNDATLAELEQLVKFLRTSIRRLYS